MTDFQQEKLRRYLLARDRLQRKCEEANRWESISTSLTPLLHGTRGASHRQPNEVKETLMQLREELERAALETRELRRELYDALNAIPDPYLRGLLESKYLSGASNRELMEQYHLSERTLRRHLGQAVRCLEKCSKFFGENA